MRKLKRIGLAVVLAATLCTSTMAGIITTPPVADPPPEPPPSDQATGITDTPPSAAQTDPVVTFALDVLQTLISAF
jgi:hypothetical protein